MTPEVIKLCGGDRIIYCASDYYHWDCAFPDTVKMLAERTNLSESTKKKMFSQNSKQLFGP